MGQTLQYGLTRAQESLPVNSDMSCEEISKIGFFCESVTQLPLLTVRRLTIEC
jgi:hypothetical protein